MLKGRVYTPLRVRAWRAKICLLSIFFFSCLFAEAQPSANASHKVTLLLSGPDRLYLQTVEALEESLPKGLVVRRYQIEQWNRSEDTHLLIAVGAAATQIALNEKPNAALLSILLPSNTFYSLLAESPAGQKGLDNNTVSAIFMDQPGERQLNLATLVDPDLKNLGTLYDAHSSPLITSLESAAKEKGIHLLARQLEHSENPVAALREMYADIDMFIAVPGKYIFNRSTAKWMLYLSYRNRKPLLGFSANYVQSGALAAVYTLPSDIGQQAAAWIKMLDFEHLALPAASYPQKFSVSVNPEIAQRLGKQLPSEAEIIQALKAMETKP